MTYDELTAKHLKAVEEIEALYRELDVFAILYRKLQNENARLVEENRRLREGDEPVIVGAELPTTR